jgi:anti-sigma regulatory factor (Ser/Thr protein kinase)
MAPDWECGINLDNAPQAARIARGTVRAALSGYHLWELQAPAELITSEVVGNAHRHTDGPIVVRVRWSAPNRLLRIAVWDASLTPPRLRTPSLDEETGRGLGVVASIARRWGCYPMCGTAPGHHGKVVWAEVAESMS